MTWVKLDDQFAENDEVAELTDRAFRLHVIALCYCGRNLTDGILDERGIRVVSAVLTPSRTIKWLRELVESGLWIDRGDGTYEIGNYLHYNPSREHVKEERRKARERMAKRRSSEERSPEPTPEHSRERSSVRSPSPTRPVVRTTNPKAVGVDATNGLELLSTGTEGARVILMPELRAL